MFSLSAQRRLDARMPLPQHWPQPHGRLAQPVPPHAPQDSAQQIGEEGDKWPLRQFEARAAFLARTPAWKRQGGEPQLLFWKESAQHPVSKPVDPSGLRWFGSHTTSHEPQCSAQQTSGFSAWGLPDIAAQATAFS